MSRWKLREAIAAEAARLMLRGSETDYRAARKQAARWLSKRKLAAEDLPSDAEIQLQIHALAGWTFDESSDENEPGDLDLDVLAALRMMVLQLQNVPLDPVKHPEGDGCYHSLQVFELGRAERPYDEEFLLACLLHDIGKGINRRQPILAALDALDGLVTERTLFLIEQLPVAAEYLKTGQIPRSLRRSQHFDDLVLLARCDRDGRVPGAEVCDLDEALYYLATLESRWDDPEE